MLAMKALFRVSSAPVMWAGRLSTPQPEPKTDSKPASEPEILATVPVLHSLDIDGTLLHRLDHKFERMDEEAGRRYQAFLWQTPLVRHSFNLVNTGRGVTGTQGENDYLSQFPIDGLSLNNGQLLFINPHLFHHHAPTGPLQQRRIRQEETRDWMTSLSLKDQDTHWQQVLGDEEGWSFHDVMGKVLRFFETGADGLGATQSPRNGEGCVVSDIYEGEYRFQFNIPADLEQPLLTDDHQYIVSPEAGGKTVPLNVIIFPDQMFFQLSREDEVVDPRLTEFAKVLGHKMAKCLTEDPDHTEDQPVLFLPKAHRFGDKFFVSINPVNIHKGLVVDYLIRERLDGVKAIISAGDNFNDIPILSLPYLAGVPNYPVLIGSHKETAAELARFDPPRLVQVQDGQLNQGLYRQWQAIGRDVQEARNTQEGGPDDVFQSIAPLIVAGEIVDVEPEPTSTLNVLA